MTSTVTPSPIAGRLSLRLQYLFVRVGVLPVLLIVAVLIFSLLSDNFLTQQNLLNVARQSTFLTIVAMGQMLALLTGGFDLAVGKTIAITSVIGAMVMAGYVADHPEDVAIGIAVGVLAGLAAGTLVGV